MKKNITTPKKLTSKKTINFVMIKDMVLKTRSYRRFHQDIAIKSGTLRELVDLARLSASAANRQPLKYFLSHEPEKNSLIFQHLSWAGYLKEWDGPVEGERPSAYIVVLGDRDISQSFGHDAGIAIQNILLGATEKGLGGCIIGSIRRQGLRNALDIPERFEILLVLALGVPREKVVIETTGDDGDIRYWRDGGGVHHVPKRRLDDIIIGQVAQAGSKILTL
jgi:nitroreductase